MKAPKMRLARVRAAAMTYELHVPEPLGGWALCTVNDKTGELLITSDWDDWSYRWSPDPYHLGCSTLTEFIGDRNAVDYMACKLNPSNAANRAGKAFDPDETAKAFIRIVAKKRLEDGRRAIELALDDEITVDEATHRLDAGQDKYDRFLTKDAARGLCDSIEEVAQDFYGTPCIDNDSVSTLFLERFYVYVCDRHDAHDLFPDPWDELQYSQTFADRVLRESILPVLIEACRQTHIGRMLVAANGPQELPE